MDFILNDKLDTTALAKEFKKKGRLQVNDALTEDSANALYETIRDKAIWSWQYRDGTAMESLSGPEVRTRTQRRQNELLQKIYFQARDQFQHFYLTRRLGEAAPNEPEDRLTDVDAFARSDAFVNLVKTIGDAKSTELVEPYCLWTHRDHFQTDNENAPDDLNSKLVFMLDLTPKWRTDWGGLTHFLDDKGNVAETWGPSFNTLNLIALPARYSMSYVTSFVGELRLAVCGHLV